MLLQSDCLCIVAKVDRKIIGFISGRIVENIIHILSLGVVTEHRRANVGTTLVKKLLNALSNKNHSDYQHLEFHTQRSTKMNEDISLAAKFCYSLNLEVRSTFDSIYDGGRCYYGLLQID